MTPELKLLLSCARVVRSHADEAAIGQMLEDGIDWMLWRCSRCGESIEGGARARTGPRHGIKIWRLQTCPVRVRNAQSRTA